MVELKFYLKRFFGLMVVLVFSTWCGTTKAEWNVDISDYYGGFIASAVTLDENGYHLVIGCDEPHGDISVRLLNMAIDSHFPKVAKLATWYDTGERVTLHAIRVEGGYEIEIYSGDGFFERLRRSNKIRIFSPINGGFNVEGYANAENRILEYCNIGGEVTLPVRVEHLHFEDRKVVKSFIIRKFEHFASFRRRFKEIFSFFPDSRGGITMCALDENGKMFALNDGPDHQHQFFSTLNHSDSNIRGSIVFGIKTLLFKSENCQRALHTQRIKVFAHRVHINEKGEFVEKGKPR